MFDTKVPSYQDGLKDLRENLNKMLPAEELAIFDQDAQSLQKNHPTVLQLGVGESAPDFTLSNAVNELVTLSQVLEQQRVVLVFYRGTWCPYCNLALAQYQQILPEIQAAGATLVAISPQTPDESLNIQEKNALAFEVLSDPGNLVARRFTTVFRNGEQPVAAMGRLGYDYDSFYADDTRELPIPAVFIIERDGTVSFAQSEGGDYRNRVEPVTILQSLQK